MSEPEMVTLTREQLRLIFDLAVGSMDFGSGFWYEEDVMAARAVAKILGVDPGEGTPTNFRSEFNHPLDGPDFRGLCRVCLEPPDHASHTGGKRD